MKKNFMKDRKDRLERKIEAYQAMIPEKDPKDISTYFPEEQLEWLKRYKHNSDESLPEAYVRWETL